MVEKLVDIDQLDGSDAKSFLNKHQHAGLPTDTIEKAVDAIKGLPMTAEPASQQNISLYV